MIERNLTTNEIWLSISQLIKAKEIRTMEDIPEWRSDDRFIEQNPKIEMRFRGFRGFRVLKGDYSRDGLRLR